MIFPEHCKYVGIASTKPCGERVYFLSRYFTGRRMAGMSCRRWHSTLKRKG